MFDRILIANRGEIACRVIRTARAMGIQTVAVYSDADQMSRHVREADMAVRIGPAAAAQSYLQGERIIEAALRTGAQAIHPGYGFLSENPDFVDAVTAAGLVFIGPSAAAIRSMGLKDAAKALMLSAGVPVVPGYHGAAQDDLLGKAKSIGFPVIIKAVAGGGGKGMRVVQDAEQFPQALASAQSEARSAFGNDHVLLEKYIASPRHIEVQVFGDGKTAVHLFERDCSLQRRFQKVIEEAPAPEMTDDLRAAMGQAAVRAAIAIGYQGAGTVEFIVDASGPLRVDGFWFMEMNTRLQVEHPVTEAITGIDLVEWQLKVAAGQGLPLTQDQISMTGHAFEARLYAEDVPAGFLPATGRIAHLAFPQMARAESGVSPGDEISAWYDPLIAKIIVQGADRPTALALFQDALAGLEVAGTTTNLNFLRALTGQADFGVGQVDTGLIARHLDALTQAIPITERAIAQAVLTLTGLQGPPNPLTGFVLWHPLAKQIAIEINGVATPAQVVVRAADQIEIRVLAKDIVCRWIGSAWRFDGHCPVAQHLNASTVTDFASGTIIHVPDPNRYMAGLGPVLDSILAPMPGLLRGLMVAPGETVVAGQPLAILEAMKMEHILRAPRDGVIARTGAAVGAQISNGSMIAMLEPLS